MKTALVTGSSGFLGRHFVQALANRDYQVIEIDIRTGHDCRTMSDRYVDLVVHCAANVGGRQHIDHAPLWVAETFELDRAVIDWAVRNDPAHFLYISSSAVYSTHWQQRGTNYSLHEENHYPDGYGQPDGIYGFVKYVGELSMQYLAKCGIKTHIVRPFSGYGTDQDLDYPFPTFIWRALHQQSPFEVWGDGTQIRDFIHVDDLVEGALSIVDANVRVPVNLGTGIGISFAELAHYVCNLAGHKPDYLAFMREQPTGVHRRVANNHRFHEIYVPQITLEEGIVRALNHIN